MTSPSEDETQAESRPLPCPECQSTKGYNPTGAYRVTCKNCNSTIRREEVDMQISNEETT